MALVEKSPLFDKKFYKAGAKVRFHESACASYLRRPASESVDPSRHFSTAFYLSNNTDVATSGINPLLHYLKYGWREGRWPNPDFDPLAFAAAHSDEATSDRDPAELCLSLYGRVEWPLLDVALTPDRAMRARTVERHHYTYELLKPDGVVPSRRPTNDTDFALEVPFGFGPLAPPPERVAAIVHAFYPDVMPAILDYLRNVPCAVDLHLSTDTEEKRAALEEICAGWSKGTHEIRLFPNRGRDIAPKFVGFRDVYERYEIFLHAHTKRSPHGGDPLAGWRDHLLGALCGSPEIAAAALHLLADPRVGVVFPQHLFELRGILNWGYDYDHARGLLRRMGVILDKDAVLEFPSGSMFWAKSAAIRKILDLGLDFSDFPDEAGQIDGTLAHAIERIILFVAESSGFEWTKVIPRDAYPVSRTVLPVEAPADLARHRTAVFRPVLGRIDSGVRPSERSIVETRALLSYPSRNPRPRLNLLVPTINPSQTFGGVATALRLFDQIARALGPDFDRRIVVTCAAVEEEARRGHPDYVFRHLGVDLDEEPAVVVDAYERGRGRLNLRDGDVFMATAWWTARFAYEFVDTLRRAGRHAAPVVYLIQDDEPRFYGWSTKSAFAADTYERGADTIAVINSEELCDDLLARHSFSEVHCLPYALNAKISAALSERKRERKILVYGRPSVERNAFQALMDALFLWQQRNPVTAAGWKIVSLGEDYPLDWAFPVQNVEVGGKADLDTYAEHLSTASVGVSLMVSPHPSYPPLEMAEAGLLTITNRYAGKDLHHRFDDIVSVDGIEPTRLAEAIEEAVTRAEGFVGRVKPRAVMRRPASASVPSFDAGRVAASIEAHLRHE